MGNFAYLREMFSLSGSRTVPVFAIGTDVVVGFDRRRLEEVLRAHGYLPSGGGQG